MLRSVVRVSPGTLLAYVEGLLEGMSCVSPCIVMLSPTQDISLKELWLV